ncbi:MAG: Crp/Fnr family transcriptional regulator [Cyclobacteriaceae bacterium]|nr:Crp/Fnr family transcriptional regulator [Cyclobacteriaceae bacterium]
MSDTLTDRLAKIARLQKVKKGKFLHKPGTVCHFTYFINSGIVRIYYKKSSKEITDNFSAEGEWITSVYSFMTNVPDRCYIQALEDSELIAIDLQQLEQCFMDFPEMERFGRMLISKYFLEQSERIISFRFHSASEKYQYFLRVGKNKIQRVPLGMLASFLGITQETLSRVRAEK